MITPTQADIGRSVRYQRPEHTSPERGIITSFNEHVVFVRYSHQHPTSPGQATTPDDLHWDNAS